MSSSDDFSFSYSDDAEGVGKFLSPPPPSPLSHLFFLLPSLPLTFLLSSHSKEITMYQDDPVVGYDDNIETDVDDHTPFILHHQMASSPPPSPTSSPSSSPLLSFDKITTKMSLSFQDVGYVVPTPPSSSSSSCPPWGGGEGGGGREKTILEGVGAICPPGSFLAILGPSGAGKVGFVVIVVIVIVVIVIVVIVIVVIVILVLSIHSLCFVVLLFIILSNFMFFFFFCFFSTIDKSPQYSCSTKAAWSFWFLFLFSFSLSLLLLSSPFNFFSLLL